MSKTLNLFDKPKSDGHKTVKNTISGPVIYCPVTKDNKTGTYTSVGVICAQCNKMVY